jgi:transcriptional regulator with XRE-family HTH domain
MLLIEFLGVRCRFDFHVIGAEPNRALLTGTLNIKSGGFLQYQNSHAALPKASETSFRQVSYIKSLHIGYQWCNMYNDGLHMITASQLRAARALLGIDQACLAQRASLSLPTIQRMETSGGLIRGNVDSLVKIVQALEDMGIELIGDGSESTVGGRGVRLREREKRTVVQEPRLNIREQKMSSRQPAFR